MMPCVTQIYCYPIKGLGGIELVEADVEATGLHLDRRWMLVNEEGVFLSQRTCNGMAHLHCAKDKEGIQVINRLTGDQILVPLQTIGDKRRQVSVWGDAVDASLVGEEWDRWFSQQLDRACHLVHMDSACQRLVDSKYRRADETVSFADAMPILLTNEASLKSLCDAMGEDIEMVRFRPNVVIAGASPYGEDSWQTIAIGGMNFRVTKSCARCVVTTIDPKTGKRHSKAEPLRTLTETHRDAKGRPAFGQYLIPEGRGAIRKGAALEIVVAG